MSKLDDQLRDALRARAVDVEPAGVFDRVARRRQVRRVRRVAIAALLVAVLAGTTAVIAATADGSHHERINAGEPTTPTTATPAPPLTGGRLITVPDGPASSFCARAEHAWDTTLDGAATEVTRNTLDGVRVVVCNRAVDGHGNLLWLRSRVSDGTQWRAVAFGSYADAFMPGVTLSVIMVDAQHGWIVESTSSSPPISRLWRTTDGGASWAVGGLPGVPTEVKFSSRTDGTLLAPNGSWTTRDGGESWIEDVATTAHPVPLHVCPTFEASLGDERSAIISRAQPNPAAGTLDQYEDAFGRLTVLAPHGWSCRARMGEDGSGILAVYPGTAPYDFNTNDAHDGPVITAFTDGACMGCTRDHLSTHPGEQTTRVDATKVKFTDPPGTRGTGLPSGGANTAIGAAIWDSSNDTSVDHIVTCSLPVAEQTVCPPVVDEFVTRYH